MILVAFGTRPEIIKLFPVINTLNEQGLHFRTVFTGQQMDLYEDVKELVPVPGGVRPYDNCYVDAKHTRYGEDNGIVSSGHYTDFGGKMLGRLYTKEIKFQQMIKGHIILVDDARILPEKMIIRS